MAKVSEGFLAQRCDFFINFKPKLGIQGRSEWDGQSPSCQGVCEGSVGEWEGAELGEGG